MSKGTTHIRISKKAKKYLEKHGKERGFESLRKAVDDMLFERRRRKKKWNFRI